MGGPLIGKKKEEGFSMMNIFAKKPEIREPEKIEDPMLEKVVKEEEEDIADQGGRKRKGKGGRKGGKQEFKAGFY